MPTTAVIVQNTPVAMYLAANAIEKSKIGGKGSLDENLAIKVRMVYRFIKKIYDLNPNYAGMYAACNYMWQLLGPFGLMALGITGTTSGGGQITPITPIAPWNFKYLIPAVAAQFTDATHYDNPDIAGKQLEVYWKNIPNFESAFGWRFIYTSTGIQIFVDDGMGGNSFDAFGANADAEFEIFIVNPVATAASSTAPGPQVSIHAGVGGEIFWTDPLLVGKTVLMVLRPTPCPIVGGSPTGIQCTFNSLTGTITFASTFPFVNSDDIAYALYV